MKKANYSTKNKQKNQVNATKKTECTAIVFWGSNMGYNWGYKYISQIVRSMFKFTNFVRSVIIGIILSDGWFNLKGRQINPYLGFEQSIKHFAYFWHVFNILKPYMASWFSFKVRISSFANQITPSHVFSMVLITRCLPCLIEIYNLFIINNIKTIQVDLINYFDAIVFAHWIMGDGTRNAAGGLILCTDCYSAKEVVLLINILMIKYDLQCSMPKHNGKYRIYISTKSMDKVRSLVESHIIPEMQYKISKNQKKNMIRNY